MTNRAPSPNRVEHAIVNYAVVEFVSRLPKLRGAADQQANLKQSVRGQNTARTDQKWNKNAARGVAKYH